MFETVFDVRQAVRHGGFVALLVSQPAIVASFDVLAAFDRINGTFVIAPAFGASVCIPVAVAAIPRFRFGIVTFLARWAFVNSVFEFFQPFVKLAANDGAVFAIVYGAAFFTRETFVLVLKLFEAFETEVFIVAAFRLRTFFRAIALASGRIEREPELLTAFAALENGV